MTGNVTAEVVGNVLTLTGDDLANRFYLTRTSATQIHLQPALNDDTTFNGAATLDLNFAQGGELKLDLRGGFDQVTINDGATDFELARLSVDMGSGPNRLLMYKVDLTNPGTTTIRLGNPDEVANQHFVWSGMSHKFGGNLNIVTGAGNDIIGLSFGDFARSLRIDTGAGDDHVNLGNSTVGRNTTLVVGDGKNDIEVSDVVMKGSLRITAGVDHDKLTVTNVKSPRADIRLSGGDNELTIAGFAKLAGPVAASRLFIDVGDGDDLLNLSTITALNTRIRLGAGSNQLAAAFNDITTCRFGGGDGQDKVILEQSQFRSLRADLAAGDDQVLAASGANVKISRRLLLLGGAGANTLDDDGLTQLPAGPAAVTIRDFTLL